MSVLCRPSHRTHRSRRYIVMVTGMRYLWKNKVVPMLYTIKLYDIYIFYIYKIEIWTNRNDIYRHLHYPKLDNKSKHFVSPDRSPRKMVSYLPDVFRPLPVIDLPLTQCEIRGRKTMALFISHRQYLLKILLTSMY